MLPLAQKLIFAVSLLLLLPVWALAQTAEVTQIRISSSWGGLGTPAHDQLVITRKRSDYYANGKKVNAVLVSNLLAALNAPTISDVDLANLGITQEWLDANAEPAIKEYADFYYSAAAPNLQALYLSNFKDITLMKGLSASLYRGWWTDDYPLVEVEVTKAEGTKLVATSKAQQLFMLPWEMSVGNQNTKTYNADIARAIVALLPKKFVNRERLAGEGLRRKLAESVMMSIKHDWELLDAKNKAGKYFETLTQRFLIMEAEVNSYHNLDFGQEWINGDSGVENLQVSLDRNDPPANLSIGIALPFKNGAVEGVDTFMTGVDRYVNLVLSVPWLNEFIRSNPRTYFQLRYVGDRSFGEKAFQIFAADMRLQKKESLVREVEAVQKEVSLLSIGWRYNRDYWLVLPDKRVVLWRFNRYGKPIKFPSAASSAWDCSKYQDKCVGAMISVDGELVGQ
jgi:hypothetical protein